MPYVFEVYYRPPRDLEREQRMTDEVTRLGGRLDCWEDSNGFTGICLTFECDDKAQAIIAVDALREQGERIDTPPRPYGE